MLAANSQLSDKDRKIGTFLVVLYLFCYYVRPQEIIPGLGEIRIVGVLFLITTIWGFYHIRQYVFKTPLIIIIILGVVFFLSGIGAVNVGSYKLAIKFIFEFFPQCLAVYLVFDSKERIIKLIHLWGLIYFFMALITIKNGGLGPGDFTWDPNDASLALSMGIPLCLYVLRFLDISTRQKWFYLGTLALLIAAIIVTNSRGGFLGLIAVILIIWWFSRKRLKIAMVSTVLAIALSSILFSILPDDYLKEMESINDPTDETRVERLRTWEIAWVMYKDNIILGVGGGNFAYNAGHYQRQTSWWTGNEKSLQGRLTHSVYFQVLADLGTLGTLIYLYVMFILPLRLNKLRKRIGEDTEEQKLVKMFAMYLIVAMGGFAIAGAFISVAYYPHIPIWITMYAILLRYVTKNRESLFN